MKLKTLAIGLVLIALAACSSPPKSVPMPQPQQPPQQIIAPPVEVVPEVSVPITENQQPSFVQNYQGPIPGSIEDFQYVSGEDRIYFGYDQYNLTAFARDVLRKQAQWLNNYPNAVVVIGGNADERGTREYNLALGARRAEATKAFLVSQGVAPNRVTTVSYGKERPIDPGSNAAAWARNRNAHSSVLVGGNG